MEQVQRKRSSQTAEQEEVQAPADLRDEQISEDVSCCLAEIDSVLQETQDEEDKAVEEFNELVARRYDEDFDIEDELRIWQAKYAHLGLQVGWCCGEPYYYKSEG